jgi:hypothetical protein
MAKKAQRKTQPGAVRVTDFVQKLEGAQLKRDTKRLMRLFRDATGFRARMWGPSIIGYGQYGYRLANGEESRAMATGFSPRKSGPTVYVMPGFDRYHALLDRLGPHRLGKSCLYLKRLDDIDLEVLKTLVAKSLEDMEGKYRIMP